jgi:4-amino-4-deoxy-L-arabinose transferase-like glycosyltransferase
VWLAIQWKLATNQKSESIAIYFYHILVCGAVNFKFKMWRDGIQSEVFILFLFLFLLFFIFWLCFLSLQLVTRSSPSTLFDTLASHPHPHPIRI